MNILIQELIYKDNSPMILSIKEWEKKNIKEWDV